jgi:hypothetical protein
VSGLACWEFPKLVPTFRVGSRHKSTIASHSYIRRDGPKGEKEWATRCEEATLERDRKCVLSGATTKGCGRAYLVPKGQRQLYRQEKLHRLMGHRALGRDKWNLHHAMNGITLQSDLLEVYNSGGFIIVPRGEHMVAHFFGPSTELGLKYDQQPIRLSSEIPKGYVLIQVAIAAFELAKDFIEQDEK